MYNLYILLFFVLIANYWPWIKPLKKLTPKHKAHIYVFKNAYELHPFFIF